MLRVSVQSIAICMLLIATAPIGLCQKPGQENMESIRTTAKIKGIRGAYLLCVNDDGLEMVVKVPDGKQPILYTGSAHPDWLRPGMFVSLSAKLDKKGQASAPISDLAVITPTEETKIGAFPDVSAAAGAELFSNEPAEKRADKPIPYAVTGKIVGVRNGVIKVQAGRAGLEFELADDAHVRVQVANPRLAQLDDTAVIQGWHFKGRPSQIQARSLSIESSKVLGEPKKKPTPPPANEE